MGTTQNVRASETQIANLLFMYCEFIDAGDLISASNLFEHAKLKMITSTELQDYKTLLTLLRQVIIIYPDGTPKTKHVVSNAIIDIDESMKTATSRSHYTVFQATENIPLQVIANGRYFDKFEYVDNKWRFTYREGQSDMLGIISGHLRLNSELLESLSKVSNGQSGK
jgi:hypothetical protein